MPGERDKDLVEDGTLPAPDAAQAGTLPAPDAAQAGTMPAAPTNTETFRIGARVGDRYEIRRFLGQGGMGAVFLAHDELLDKEVALKTLRASGLGSESLVRALRDEVLLAQKVTHPNVCRTYDLSVVDGVQIVKMEYVDGESLAHQLRARTRFSPDEAIAVCRQLTAGLAAAHAQGVVHRDLKPQNILIEKVTGRVVIMDFGLAKLDARTSGATEEGISGTPEYIAPEQAQGKAVDARADLYALGCVLYQLLVGEVPFTAPTRMAIVQKHIDQPPPDPRLARPELPSWIGALILALLAKDPVKRPPSANAVSTLLDAPLARRKRRRRLALVATVNLLLVGAALLAVRRSAQQWTPSVRALLPSYDENAGGPQISPDGTRIAYESNRDGTWRVYVGPLEGPGARPITPAGFVVQYPRWLADGRTLVFQHDKDLFQVAIDQGSPTLVVRNAFAAAACNDRLAIAYTGTPDCPNCYRVTLRNHDGTENEIGRLPADTWFYGPIACNDRIGVAYSVTPRTLLGDQQPADLWLSPVDGGGPQRFLTSDRHQNQDPTFDASRGTVVFASSRAGAMNLWEVSTNGASQRQLTFGAGPDLAPAISPDGKVLLYDHDVTCLPVHAYSLDAGKATRITQAQVNVANPIVAGSELIAIMSRAGKDQVVAVPIGGGDERVLSAGSVAAIAPNGTTMYVAVANNGSWSIRSMTVDGGSPRTVGALPARPISLSVSTDDELYFSTTSAAGIEAWRMNTVDGSTIHGDHVQSRASVPNPRWELQLRPAPSNRYIARIVHLDGVLPVAELTLDMFAWAPDGRSFVYARGAEVRRRELAHGRDTLLFKNSDLVSSGIAVSGDDKTIYFVAAVGRVQRQIMTNFGERPPLR